jgi:WD40 repeat protein
VLLALAAGLIVVGRRFHALEPRAWPKRPIVSLEFSGDGSRLLAVADDNTYLLLDTMNPLDRRFGARRRGAGRRGAMSPDGKLAIFLTDTHNLYATDLVDLERGSVIRTFESGPFTHAMAFSPDGHIVAWSSDTGVHLAELPDGREVAAFVRPSLPNAWALAFAPDSRSLAVMREDAAVLVLDVRSRQETQIDVGAPGSVASLRSVAFSPDGRWLAVGDRKTLTVWDLEERHRKWTTSGFVEHLEWTRDGRRVVTMRGIYDSANGRVLPRKDREDLQFAVAPDGEAVAIGRLDGTIKLESLDAFLNRFEGDPGGKEH